MNAFGLGEFALERYFAKFEFTVPHLLCCSDCETVTVKELLALPRDDGGSVDDAVNNLLDVSLAYTESDGDPQLRKAIAATSETCSADDVLVLAGASEGILIAISAAVALAMEKKKTADAGTSDGTNNNNDDQPPVVIAQAPGYESLYAVARAAGAEVVLWTPETGGGGDDADRAVLRWSLETLASLSRAAGDRLCLVVANSPHNPSGFSLGGFSGVLEAAGDGVRVFCDEVYRGLGECPRLGCDASPRAVSLGVLSKSYGLPGLRVGWVMTRDAKLLDRCRRLHDYTTICTAATSERLAIEALARSKALLKRTNDIRSRNLDVLDAFFGERFSDLFAWQRPAGGSIAFVRMRAPGERKSTPLCDAAPGTVDELCDMARDRAGVLLLPGSAMGEAADAERFRIGYGRENMAAVLEKLGEMLDGLAASSEI